MDLPEIDPLLDQMAERLRDRFRRGQPPALIGIQTGGVWIAEALRQRLGRTDPLGVLNISFYRDDFTRIGLHPQVEPSELPFSVEGQHLVLVDDIIMSGRTVRAALNELFDYGRPASVTLAVLLDVGRRELPLQPDICGAEVQLETQQRIKLQGPAPLSLRLDEQKAR